MQLPDLFAHEDLENEWWYYHGHLANGPQEFGFHLVFFRRRTDGVRVGRVLPVRLASDQIRFAHFSLTDISRRQFYYGQRRSVIGNAGSASDRYEVWMGDWFAKGSEGSHYLQAKVRGIDFNLELRPTKPAVDHQRDVAMTQHGAHEHYLTYSRMEAHGSLTLNSIVHPITGQAWMDREFGAFTFNKYLNGWDWFAIQLDDGRDLLVFQMRDERNMPSEHSTVLFIDCSGSVERFGLSGLRVTPSSSYTSPFSSNTYPMGWRVEISGVAAELSIESCLSCQELDTRGSTNVIYWEGPARVGGKVRGEKVSGRCYVELSGYDRYKRRLGRFDFANNNLGFLGFLANEARLRLFGPGIRVFEENGRTCWSMRSAARQASGRASKSEL
jgi:predicted secreted hydrolase